MGEICEKWGKISWKMWRAVEFRNFISLSVIVSGSRRLVFLLRVWSHGTTRGCGPVPAKVGPWHWEKRSWQWRSQSVYWRLSWLKWKYILCNIYIYIHIHLRQINQRLAEVELSNVIIDCTSTMVTVLVSQWRIAASWRNCLIPPAHFKGLDVLVPLLGHHVSAEQSSKRFQPTVFHLNYPPKIITGILLKTWEILLMEGIPNNHLGCIKPCK